MLVKYLLNIRSITSDDEASRAVTVVRDRARSKVLSASSILNSNKSVFPANGKRMRLLTRSIARLQDTLNKHTSGGGGYSRIADVPFQRRIPESVICFKPARRSRSGHLPKKSTVMSMRRKSASTAAARDTVSTSAI